MKNGLKWPGGRPHRPLTGLPSHWTLDSPPHMGFLAFSMTAVRPFCLSAAIGATLCSARIFLTLSLAASLSVFEPVCDHASYERLSIKVGLKCSDLRRSTVCLCARKFLPPPP